MTKLTNDIIVSDLNISLIIIIIAGIPAFNVFSKYNAIKYSLETSSWIIDFDTIEKIEKEREKIPFHFRKYTRYYAYFRKNGKVKIPKEGYDNLPENKDAYIILVKDKYGKTYPTRLIYHTSEFEYID